MKITMIVLPNDTPAPKITCSICSIDLTPNKATAGLQDADNHQAFACISHLSEVELLILGWADFMAAERFRYMQSEDGVSLYLMGGRKNAWFDM